MTWEWSYSPEGEAEFREELSKQTNEFVWVTWAEIQAKADPEHFAGGFDEIVYAAKRAIASTYPRDILENEIWRFAEEQRECSNGGWEVYVCPFQCHGVRTEEESHD